MSVQTFYKFQSVVFVRRVFFLCIRHYGSIYENIYILVIVVYTIYYGIKITEYFLMAVMPRKVKVVYAQVQYDRVDIFIVICLHIPFKIKLSVKKERVCKAVLRSFVAVVVCRPTTSALMRRIRISPCSQKSYMGIQLLYGFRIIIFIDKAVSQKQYGQTFFIIICFSYLFKLYRFGFISERNFYFVLCNILCFRPVIAVHDRISGIYAYVSACNRHILRQYDFTFLYTAVCQTDIKPIYSIIRYFGL